MKTPILGSLLFKALSGSRLHGTHTDTSDYDYRGVMLDPPETLIGLEPMFNQRRWSNADPDGTQMDYVLYGLRKFCLLGLEANPNILDILFTPPEFWYTRSEAWQLIYDNRHRFLSKKVRNTFGGYARLALKGVQQGRSTSGTARQPIIDRYGWDVKDGAALVRLIYSGISLLSEGTYSPALNGAQLRMVRRVRNGEYSRDAVIAFADNMLRDIDDRQADLPDEPDRAFVHNLVMEILEDAYWSE